MNYVLRRMLMCIFVLQLCFRSEVYLVLLRLVNILCFRLVDKLFWLSSKNEIIRKVMDNDNLIQCRPVFQW